MEEEKYVCRKCGFEFSAIPGQEEPPDCPECQSDETEKLEYTSLERAPPDGREKAARQRLKKKGRWSAQGNVRVCFRALQQRRRKRRSHSGQWSRLAHVAQQRGRRTS